MKFGSSKCIDFSISALVELLPVENFFVETHIFGAQQFYIVESTREANKQSVTTRRKS